MQENPITKRLLNKNGHSFIPKNPLLIALIQFWKIHFETIQFRIHENAIKNTPLKNILRAMRTTFGRTSIMKNGKRIKVFFLIFVCFLRNIVTQTKSVQSHVKI